VKRGAELRELMSVLAACNKSKEQARDSWEISLVDALVDGIVGVQWTFSKQINKVPSPNSFDALMGKSDTYGESNTGSRWRCVYT
jgi:hypothetical protein